MIRVAKYKHVILYGISLSAMLFLLRWMEWKFLIIDNAIEIYIGLIACIFTALGIWLALKLSKPKIETRIVEKPVYVSDFEINQVELDKLNLRPREFEALQLMSQGLSNAEIGEKLFISLSTVKTHVSGLFEKMEVKSRTQAIEKAKRLRIIE
jgi:NarL family two-component system response regulator LiaR